MALLNARSRCQFIFFNFQEKDKPSEEVEFIYHVKEITRNNNEEETKEYTIKIGVGEHYGWISIPEFSRIILYNFNRELITEIDTKNQTCEERSMIGDVAMNHEELLSRLELNQQTQIRLNLAELEASLHMAIPDDLKKVFGRGVSSQVVPKFVLNENGREVTFFLEETLDEIAHTLTLADPPYSKEYDQELPTVTSALKNILRAGLKETKLEEIDSLTKAKQGEPPNTNQTQTPKQESISLASGSSHQAPVQYAQIRALDSGSVDMFNKILIHYFDLHPVVYQDVVSQTRGGNFLKTLSYKSRDWLDTTILQMDLQHVRKRFADLVTFKVSYSLTKQLYSFGFIFLSTDSQLRFGPWIFQDLGRSKPTRNKLL